MNRKSFLILVAALLLLGGVGLALFWQDVNAWRNGDTKVGAKPFAQLQVNDIVQIHLTDGKGEATLVIKDKRWVVKERNDYPANYADIAELLIKLPDVKVAQTEKVGASLLPRLELVQPAKEAKDNVGTRFELTDKKGVVTSLLLGKQVIKIEDSPLPIKPHTPVGRYILIPGNPLVLVLSDALKTAEAKPARWLAKDLFKVDRIKSLAASGAGAPWKIDLPEEYGQWKFADSKAQLDGRAASEAVKSLAEPTFTDVDTIVKRESLEKPATFIAETFDNLTYTIKVAKQPGADDYFLWFTLSGVPPSERVPEKGEKAEDKAANDKRFVEDRKKLVERIAAEQSRANWTYVVESKTLAALLKERAQLTAVPRK